LSAIGERAIRRSWEASFSCEGGGFFCAIGGSLFWLGPTSIALSGGTPCQKENQCQRHKGFNLLNIPYVTITTIIVRCLINQAQDYVKCFKTGPDKG
jgi:hypothetical protein